MSSRSTAAAAASATDVGGSAGAMKKGALRRPSLLAQHIARSLEAVHEQLGRAVAGVRHQGAERRAIDAGERDVVDIPTVGTDEVVRSDDEADTEIGLADVSGSEV